MLLLAKWAPIPVDLPFSLETIFQLAIKIALPLCFLANVIYVIAVSYTHLDVEMLKFAGFPIAMGNGTEEVKKIARAVAPSCEEDGAARAILDWIL